MENLFKKMRCIKYGFKYVQRHGSTSGIIEAIEPKKIVSSPFCAKVLGIKSQTLRKWRMQGKGPKVTPLGKRPGYRMADLAKFVEESSTMQPEFKYSLRHPWAYSGPYPISTIRRKP